MAGVQELPDRADLQLATHPHPAIRKERWQEIGVATACLLKIDQGRAWSSRDLINDLYHLSQVKKEVSSGSLLIPPLSKGSRKERPV